MNYTKKQNDKIFTALYQSLKHFETLKAHYGLAHEEKWVYRETKKALAMVLKKGGVNL